MRKQTPGRSNIVGTKSLEIGFRKKERDEKKKTNSEDKEKFSQ